MTKVESPAVDMVRIPGGRITLRDDRLGTSWTATINPVLVSRYPVTQALYEAVTGQSPSAFQGTNHPVESVSWLDAAAFCNRLSRDAGLPGRYRFDPDRQDAQVVTSSDGFRLPTEAEWEFACRAGTSEPRYGPVDDIAWYRANASGSTNPVGGRQPNAWGLYDMLGNVWECCEDIYDPEVYGRYRIFRGGGWADAPRGCLATNRRRSHPTFAIDDLGFRIARG